MCDALAAALRSHGVPDAILTDNGKVFTGRFGLAKGPVLFDRICHDNGIRHLLTAPYSPTTTGKVERFHKTMRREFLNDNTFATIEEAQVALDAWVEQYNCERDHQSRGDRPPVERFRLARPQPAELDVIDGDGHVDLVDDEPALPRITRRVGADGRISLAGFPYLAGRWLAGEVAEVAVNAGLVEVWHRRVLIATHARRHAPGKERNVVRRQPRRTGGP